MAFERPTDQRGHALHREAVDLAALHAHVVGAFRENLRRERLCRAPARPRNEVCAGTVGAERECFDQSLLALGVRLKDGCACAIAEQDDRVPVVDVAHARQTFASDHEHVAVRTACQELRPRGERIEEACATGPEVEGRGARAAEAVLHDARHRGNALMISGDRGHDHEIHVFRSKLGVLERLAASSDEEIRRFLPFIQPAALTDARALDDPLVAGLNEACEPKIVHSARRDLEAEARDSDWLSSQHQLS